MTLGVLMTGKIDILGVEKSHTRDPATLGVTGLSLLTTDLASCKVLLEVTSSPYGVPMDEAKVCECCEALVLAVLSCPQSRRG